MATSSSPTPGTTGSARSTPAPAGSPPSRGRATRGSPEMAGRPPGRSSAGSTASPSTRPRRRSTWRTSTTAGFAGLTWRPGTVSTVAGNGKKGVPRDGDDARSSPLVDPRAVALDGRGNLYILERSGHALRVVDRSGKIRTVAGTGKAGRLGRRRRCPAGTIERPEAPLRRRPGERPDRRHGEPSDSHLSIRMTGRSRRWQEPAGRGPRAWEARPPTPSSPSRTG